MMKVIKLHTNCCDGIYHSYDVHFTDVCDNRCAHCIAKGYDGLGLKKPEPRKIADAIIKNSEGFKDVLFLGGEPCLFLDELLECIRLIKKETDLKVYVTSAMPITCCTQKELFYDLLSKVDGFNLSAQHYIEDIADQIRKTDSIYNRQNFYCLLPNKEKIRICLNIVRPYFCTREDILAALKHYSDMGFRKFKLSELQHSTENYASFEEIMGVKLPSPYAYGCQTEVDMLQFLPGFKGKVELKRSCFLCEESLKASFADLVKSAIRYVFPAKGKFGVVYEDGTIKDGWV